MGTEPAEQLTSISCPRCGYDLRGTEANVCSKCGLPFVRATLRPNVIPWIERRRIGVVRAYVRTVLMVTRRSSRLNDETGPLLTLSDARLFAMVTAALLVLPPVVALIVAAVTQGGSLFPLDLVLSPALQLGGQWTQTWAYFDLAVPWLAGIHSVAVAVFGTVLFGIMGVGSPSYFFHPRRLTVERQNRAIALSYYACAPFVWLWPGLIIVALGIYRWDVRPSSGVWELIGLAVLILLGSVISIVGLFGPWIAVVNLLRPTTGCGRGRVIALLLAWPFLWASCALVALGVVPWVVGFFRIVIQSTSN